MRISLHITEIDPEQDARQTEGTIYRSTGSNEGNIALDDKTCHLY